MELKNSPSTLPAIVSYFICILGYGQQKRYICLQTKDFIDLMGIKGPLTFNTLKVNSTDGEALIFFLRRQFAWNIKAYFLRKNKKISQGIISHPDKR